MNQAQIFSPFFTSIFLTLVVWVYMYVRRIKFINSHQINPQDYATASPTINQSTNPRQPVPPPWPPAVINPSDNLKNLFEMPVIFYGMVLYLFTTQQVDTTYIVAAWTFATFRILHSAVHCTFNRIIWRFYLYLISAIALWFMVLRASLAHFMA